MALLQIKNLKFTYPFSKKVALNDISLTINEGEFVVLFGTTGSGKTTLLKLIKRELAPYGDISGEIIYNNLPLKDLDDRQAASEIGYVMQNPDNQIVTDKVWNELAFGLENLGVENKAIRRRVGEMASFFGINELFRRNTYDLSGGQKQLLNLASIMVTNPRILLLDEPTAQLDPIAASEFIRVLQKLNQELGLTIIIVEHRLEEIFSIADKVIVFDQGKMIAENNPRSIGKRLHHKKLSLGLPSAVRIFNNLDIEGKCPLTVREAKIFLSKHFKNDIKSLNKKHIDFTKKDYAIELKSLWFRYEKEEDDIIRGIDLKIHKGEIFSLVGGNGSGKSTILKLIGDLITPYKGKVLIDNKNVKNYKGNSLYDNLLTILPQNPQDVFLLESVKEDLEEVLKIKSLSKDEFKKRFDEIVDLLEIDQLLNQHPYDLSGGEQQRVALSKLLLLKPQIILLDEPTKGLDQYFKNKLINILKTLQQQGITIFIVTHDIEFASLVSDECAMIFDGEIISRDNPTNFFSGNHFYTTAANRISRHLYLDAITDEDVIALAKRNGVICEE